MEQIGVALWLLCVKAAVLRKGDDRNVHFVAKPTLKRLNCAKFVDMKGKFDGITTVFLDVDDTLWWFTENSKVALDHTYRMCDIGSWCSSYELFVDTYRKKNAELWHKFHHGEISKDFLQRERFRYVLKELGYDGDCDALGAKMNDDYLDYLSRLPKTVPGAKELLAYLVGKGYDVNALSNGFKGLQDRKLVSGGIAGLVHHLVLSDDCGFTKPMRGIFDYALGVAGSTAETTVMIGDDPDADIAGARAAGWRTIFFNIKGVDSSGVECDAEVQTLDEVQALL